jgi:hypothetical protein
MQEDLALEDLKLVKQVLDKHEVPFYLAYGTCLGVYRDGDFLPGDDDIDLGIITPLSLEKRKSIGWMLYDLGFMAQDIMFRVFGRMEPSELGYNGDETTGIIVCQRAVKFTIFFFKEEECDEHGKEMVCRAKLGAPILISYPSKFTKKFEKITFNGEEFLIPSPPEAYLGWVYEYWKDPLKRDHGKLHAEIHVPQDIIKDVTNLQRTVLKKDLK